MIIINRILEAFSFDFFVRGLIIGLLLAFIYSIIGIFVVLRKESNIAHTISNFSLVGIALALYFGYNLNIMAAICSIIGALIVIKFQNTKFFSHDSIMEFMAQISMACAILIVSQLSGYRSDINSYLFGNILALSKNDFWFSLIISCVIIVLFFIFRKLFSQIIISYDLARSRGINTSLINMIFMIIVAVSISLGIKLVGILLISAFMVIPPNIGKIFAKNFTQMITFSLIIGIVGTLFGIILAYLLDAPTGAMIILNLGILLFFGVIIGKYVYKKAGP